MSIPNRATIEIIGNGYLVTLHYRSGMSEKYAVLGEDFAEMITQVAQQMMAIGHKKRLRLEENHDQ